ncbi:hypothetical protein SBV1_130076 [Verrucomicrobia bacterium]|nr:hypothetical protein SBV1_130076 [Verrucomicrobiota bacterium]
MYVSRRCAQFGNFGNLRYVTRAVRAVYGKLFNRFPNAGLQLRRSDEIAACPLGGWIELKFHHVRAEVDHSEWAAS